MSAPRTALRPWIIVAVALPLLALVAWSTGLLEAPPPAPIADRNVAALERAPAPPLTPRRPGEAPLVVFIGDSRYQKAIRATSTPIPTLRPRRLNAGGVTFEVLTYFTKAGATAFDIERLMPKIVGWSPDVVVMQPELFVEETSMRGLAPAAVSERRRLENWKVRLDLWSDKVELPKAGRALPAAKALAERLRQAGIRLIVAQIPPSEAVLKAVPEGYHATMRALVCTVLASCERDYLTFAASYPDGWFSDPLHLSAAGHKVFLPLLMQAVGHAIGLGPVQP